MMFELKIALKYLIPKRKQLSVSLIALMSVAVISLVTWLLLVFLSVTEGIEQSWLDKLTTLTSPLRITPTAQYYDSYFYNIDALSEQSHFQLKSIEEKAKSLLSDPYNPQVDRELHPLFPKAELDAQGKLVDPVKQLFSVLSQENLIFQDYEMSGALIRLQMTHKHPNGSISQNFLTQVSYLVSLSDKNPKLKNLIEEERAEIKEDMSPVVLPKSFKTNGVRLGDTGYLAYPASTTHGTEEMRLAIYVSGFYDPGVMNIGNRAIFVDKKIAHTINLANKSQSFDPEMVNGIQVFTNDLAGVSALKKRIEEKLQEEGISSYWKVTTFREYEYAKDLLNQFQSDRLLLSLVGTIILIVAGCNILSLLILLVNDKKKEIGILLSLGATRLSIASIFGMCGVFLGLFSCLLGTFASFITLRNIDTITRWMSKLQGHTAFNPLFFGDHLPNTLSDSSVTFILVAAPLIALFAGIIPAWKAATLSPTEILRSE